VLQAAGADPEARHVEFTGLDEVERHGATFGFGGSITMDKALGDEVLLATEQDGVPLQPAHGFPLRALVPGWIGARSVKWLGRITVRREPSENYFQTRAYRVRRDPDPARPTDVRDGTPLSVMNLNSVITAPSPDVTLAAGPVVLRGWAVGAEGAPVTAVECSADGGATWRAAEFAAPAQRWSWTQWQCTIDLPPGRHELTVRAHDGTGVAQPRSPRETWNAKGYMNNAWHHVAVIVR
jgi:sulfite oxidase